MSASSAEDRRSLRFVAASTTGRGTGRRTGHFSLCIICLPLDFFVLWAQVATDRGRGGSICRHRRRSWRWAPLSPPRPIKAWLVASHEPGAGSGDRKGCGRRCTIATAEERIRHNRPGPRVYSPRTSLTAPRDPRRVATTCCRAPGPERQQVQPAALATDQPPEHEAPAGRGTSTSRLSARAKSSGASRSHQISSPAR